VDEVFGLLQASCFAANEVDQDAAVLLHYWFMPEVLDCWEILLCSLDSWLEHSLNNVRQITLLQYRSQLSNTSSMVQLDELAHGRRDFFSAVVWKIV
jgi:hypothetical protein